MKRQKTKENGITLIALVISIIVMLILAGVSLNMMIGENGIVTQAQSAKLASEEVQWYEGAQMILASCYSGEEQICRLTTEEEASCAGNVTQIENLRKQKMVAYLKTQFKEISDGEDVMVNVYGEGYLIVVGKKALMVDKSYAILNSEENNYLVSSGNEWGFTVNGTGTAKLITYNLDTTGVISIPTVVTDKENGTAYVVTELGDSIFDHAVGITKIDMSATTELTKIGAQAFAFCTSLQINIPDDLPNSVTSIGDKAFNKCTLLEGNIDTILNKGYTLGKGVFSNCPNLTGQMQNVFNQTFYVVNEATGEGSAINVEEGQFSGFSGLTGPLVIPKFIKEIGDNAFYGCSGISSLTFEGQADNTSSLTKIGANAFHECSGIANRLTLPNSLTTIGNRAFYGCSKITGIDLSLGLETIPYECFSSCRGTTGELIIPNNISSIAGWAFAYTGFTSLVFENRKVDGVVKTLYMTDSLNFYACTQLSSVTFAEGVTNITPRCFDVTATNLTVHMVDTITTIGSQAFGNKNVIIDKYPANLTTIGASAFKNATSLTELPNMDSLTTIEDNAFLGCENLGKKLNNEKTDVINWLEESNITSVGASAFQGCGFLKGKIKTKTISSKKGVISIGASAFVNTDVTREGTMPTLATGFENKEISDNEFNGCTEFKQNNATITDIVIPDGVTKIGSNAFAGCETITSVYIPKSVTSIGESAFYSCNSLTTVTFETGISITTIPDTTFYYCTALEDIVIPSSVTTIGNSAFYGTSALEELDIPNNVITIGSNAFTNSNLADLTLHEGLTTIGASAFSYSGVTEVVIPDSVTSFGHTAFMVCTNLTKITIGSGVTKINAWTFSNCYRLQTVIFKGDITSFGSYSFQMCYPLKKFEKPNGNDIDWLKVTSVEVSAFNSCSLLTGTVKVNSACYIDENYGSNCPLVITK